MYKQIQKFVTPQEIYGCKAIHELGRFDDLLKRQSDTFLSMQSKKRAPIYIPSARFDFVILLPLNTIVDK